MAGPQTFLLRRVIDVRTGTRVSAPRSLRDDFSAQAFEGNTMRLRQAILLIAIISLASTAVALALQTYFGRLLWLVILGQVLAATGALAIALSLKRRP